MNSHRIRRLRRKFQVYYARHHRAFWTLHSLWALATGAVVVVLAHERYSFAMWVTALLGLTWLSTLFFSRLASGQPDSSRARAGHEIASYLTRTMYQETLFFLLPFYFASATWPSWNMLFVALLAALAVLACLDLVFDKLLRENRAFGLMFFAMVTFASGNFLLPLLFRVSPEIATPLSAAAGLVAALPLVYDAGDLRRLRTYLEVGGATLAVVAALWLGRAVVPPVPLQLSELVFAAAVEPESLEPVGVLEGPAASGGGLAAIARIFAPRSVPARVVLHWHRDGELIRTSREALISPHEHGFRVWDVVHDGGAPAGAYTVEAWTVAGQLIGRGSLRLAQ